MAATATAVEATAEPSAMETGMSKPAAEAAAEPAVPTPATTPPAAPAPADRDPGPTPAPTPRIAPTSPTPVGVWIAGVGSGITIAGVGSGITIAGVGSGITIAGISLRRGAGRRRRISRVGLRRRRGIAGIIALRRGRLRQRPDAKGDRSKSGRSNGNSPEPAPLSANEHDSLHPGSPETNVLYVYAIPIVILPVVAAVRKLSDATGCHTASRSCGGIGGGIPASAAARASHRDAGRRQPERRYLRRMAALADGSGRRQSGGATRAGAMRDGGGRRHGLPRASVRRGRGELLWRARPDGAYLDDRPHRGLAAPPALGRGA